MGRVAAIGELLGMWANIFESSPLTAIVPALMALLGFGLPTMIVTVSLFSVWVIALDTQVGVANASPSLLEIGRSFGATPRQVLTKIVLFAALPEILAGVRLGLIRGVKGVVIGQLLIAIVGIGYLFERYSRGFLMAEFWALLLIVFAFAFVLSEAVGFFERASRPMPPADEPARWTDELCDPLAAPVTLPIDGTDDVFPVRGSSASGATTPSMR